jgi:hypothetical protein
VAITIAVLATMVATRGCLGARLARRRNGCNSLTSCGLPCLGIVSTACGLATTVTAIAGAIFCPAFSALFSVPVMTARAPDLFILNLGWTERSNAGRRCRIDVGHNRRFTDGRFHACGRRRLFRRTCRVPRNGLV